METITIILISLSLSAIIYLIIMPKLFISSFISSFKYCFKYLKEHVNKPTCIPNNPFIYNSVYCYIITDIKKGYNNQYYIEYRGYARNNIDMNNPNIESSYIITNNDLCLNKDDCTNTYNTLLSKVIEHNRNTLQEISILTN